MNNDFENSLHDSLHRAVPSPPDEANRSAGAREYAARARRRRTGGLAVGAAAVVVAAIAVVASILEPNSRNAAPVAGSPQTQAPQQSGEQPDQPFECPKNDGPVKPMTTPTDGTIAPGAVLARVCPVQPEGMPWAPPLDALTSDVGAVASTVNSLPVAEDRMACNDDLGPAYLMVFQYSDGRTVRVRGDLYGCQLVSFGALERQGAGDALEAYFTALTTQRTEVGPPPVSALPAATCPESGVMSASTLIQHALSDVVLAKASVCLYDNADMSLLNQAELSADQVADLTADIRAHSNEQDLESGCPAPPEEQLVLVVRDKDGDVLVLPQTCEEGFAWLDRFWTPTQATRDMLRTALR